MVCYLARSRNNTEIAASCYKDKYILLKKFAAEEGVTIGEMLGRAIDLLIVSRAHRRNFG